MLRRAEKNGFARHSINDGRGLILSNRETAAFADIEQALCAIAAHACE